MPSWARPSTTRRRRDERDVKLNLFELTTSEKQLRGGLFGGSNPRVEIPLLLSMWREGKLNLTDLVTAKYKLEEINQDYQDMRDGKNIRGVIEYSDADR